MKIIIISVFIIALSILFISCDIVNERGVSQPYDNLREAANFNIPTPGTAVIRDSTTWINLWNLYWAVTDSSGVKTPPPAINFNKEMVVAVFWGRGYTGCSNYAPTISIVSKNSGVIIVRVNGLPNLGNCPASVFPIQMIKMDKSDMPVEFRGVLPK